MITIININQYLKLNYRGGRTNDDDPQEVGIMKTEDGFGVGI